MMTWRAMSARLHQVQRAVRAEVAGLTVAEAKDAGAEVVAVVEAERVARHGARRGRGVAVVARGAPAAGAYTRPLLSST